MGLPIQTEPIPLETDRDGVVRVAGTRVTLDTIVTAHLEGSTPQDIARQFPSVSIGDVYAVIGYYLRHTSEVDAYLQERQKHAATLRAEMESRCPPTGIRARLEASRDANRGA